MYALNAYNNEDFYKDNLSVKTNPGILDYVKSTTYGLGWFAVGGVEGLTDLGNIILHPVDSINGLNNAFYHPILTAKNVNADIQEFMAKNFVDSMIGDQSSINYRNYHALGENIGSLGAAGKVGQIAKNSSKLANIGKNSDNIVKNNMSNDTKSTTTNSNNNANNWNNNSNDGIVVAGGESVKNIITDNKAKKIFGTREGHIVDTPQNRELLINIANDTNNILGNDKFGNTWSAKLLDTGEQVWTQTRNGQIINGGINKIPKKFNSETGLSSPIRPNWK